MRMDVLRSVLGLALATAVGVGAAVQGTSAWGEPGDGQAAPAPGGARGGGRGFNLPPLLMETDAFPDGGVIPQRFTGRGGVQPAFKFSNAPQGTVAYAVIFHDIDVALQGGTGDVLHWMAWNIPASANGIPEGSLPPGSVQGNNITGQPVYMGPGAPAGARLNHYVFELYALNAPLDLPATASRDDLLKAMQGKTTAKAAYVGRFRQGEAPAAK